MNAKIHEKGQYFTKSTDLKNKVLSFILNKPSKILEPSMGRGDLVEELYRKGVSFDLFEIDDTIEPLDPIDKQSISYCDFLDKHIESTYDTIIGNPPYVKTKHGNLYIDFTRKCYELLNTNGELIFIVPSDFIKITSSSNLINEMCKNGTFTHIYHPNKENLFENASIDIIVYRYCKNTNLINNKVLFNDIEKVMTNTNGILTFSDNLVSGKSLDSMFEIGVGMVTGKESIFKNAQYGNVSLLNDKNKTEKYILLDHFPTEDEDINNYMLKNKKELIERKIKKFNENNWFEWGAMRNTKLINNNLGKECIYVNNISRKENIAFRDIVQHFGGGLIILIPKVNCDLEKISEYLNSQDFKKNYMYSGRFKIGHKQLCNSIIPNHTI